MYKNLDQIATLADTGKVYAGKLIQKETQNRFFTTNPKAERLTIQPPCNMLPTYSNEEL